jgi:uncharacterized protein YbjQ (UPF0145 family)
MGPKSSTKKKSKSPPKKIQNVIGVLANQQMPEFAVFGLTSKKLIEPAEFARLKDLYYSNVKKMNIETLKRESNELYLSMSPNVLRNRFTYLNLQPDFPKELLMSVVNDTPVARGFYIFWCRGGDECKPTHMMEIDLRENIDNFEDWKRVNERPYYEGIYIALKMPLPPHAGGRSKRIRNNHMYKKQRSMKNVPGMMYRGGEDTPTESASYFFETKDISTQPNIDPDYEEVGIIHITDTLGVNAIREGATIFANIFGQKGFNNRSYDEARNKVLTLMADEMKKQNIDRVCNVRMDAAPGTEYNSMIIANIYGTALRKKGGSSSSDFGSSTMEEMSQEKDQDQEQEQQQEQEQKEEQESGPPPPSSDVPNEEKEEKKEKLEEANDSMLPPPPPGKDEKKKEEASDKLQPSPDK